MMKNKLQMILAALIVAVMVLTACQPKPAEKVTITIGVTDQIASLDSADAYATHDWELLKNIGEGLLVWKPGSASELIPGIAQDMPTVSEDGLTYTFKLKPGIKFADGLELTAPMYAQQLNRLLTIGPSCPNDVADALAIPYVESITAPDDSTLVFKLKVPIAYFPQILASAPYLPSHPDKFPVDQCVLFPEAPIYGVGPWYISQYTQNEQLVLEPNPYYQGIRKPQVDQIIIRYFSDPQTMALAVQNGEIDIAWRFLDPELIDQLRGVEGLTVGDIEGGFIRYLIINHTMPPMDDPNVVKAFASLIDRDAIVDTVYKGAATPLYSMNPPGFLGATDAFDTMYKAPDVAAANAYLAASGYDENNKCAIELWYPPDHYGAATAAWVELIKQQLEAANFKVELKAQEWSTYVTALTGGESYQVGVLGWFYDYPDPSNYLDPFVYNGGLGTNVTVPAEGSPYGQPINEKAQQLVDLLAQADVETDLAARTELYRQAQDVYADLGVTVPIIILSEHITYRSNIHGSPEYGSVETLNIATNLEFNYSMLTKTP
jgi:peptide/nickel transport system substrate-binding protein